MGIGIKKFLEKHQTEMQKYNYLTVYSYIDKNIEELEKNKVISVTHTLKSKRMLIEKEEQLLKLIVSVNNLLSIRSFCKKYNVSEMYVGEAIKEKKDKMIKDGVIRKVGKSFKISDEEKFLKCISI